MDTCGGDEHGTQIVRAAQFNFDAPPMWLAIHILLSLPSSMLAYVPRRRPWWCRRPRREIFRF
ncbi:hypothetical protein T190_29220 [Sinorhizobium meliloti CCBAU 01290]|nr:hypothetical protein T190_29220 [Sinorhizobium meliloti CCBAU 01290]